MPTGTLILFKGFSSASIFKDLLDTMKERYKSHVLKFELFKFYDENWIYHFSLDILDIIWWSLKHFQDVFDSESNNYVCHVPCVRVSNPSANFVIGLQRDKEKIQDDKDVVVVLCRRYSSHE